jgi:sugar lactone lactonase YvrE
MGTARLRRVMTVVVRDAQPAAAVNAQLGEGPVWDPIAACLFFVDILRGRVHRFDVATSALDSYEVGQPVGAIALTDRDDLMLAVRDGFARLDLATGRVTHVADVEADRPDRRMNDGKCDPAGRFWAGTMALDERSHAGALYRLDADHHVDRMLDRVTISNGLDWSADGRMMYFIDSPTQCVDCFDFDVARGSLANRRTFVRIPPEHGMPDGLTLDSEGGVWVSLWGGGAVHRYSPRGSLDAIVRVPTSYPTSCVFGGSDFGDLYITSAAIELSEAERAAQPLAGGLFICRLPLAAVTGRPPDRYRG